MYGGAVVGSSPKDGERKEEACRRDAACRCEPVPMSIGHCSGTISVLGASVRVPVAGTSLFHSTLEKRLALQYPARHSSLPVLQTRSIEISVFSDASFGQRIVALAPNRDKM
jgi:hypothetical protein